MYKGEYYFVVMRHDGTWLEAHPGTLAQCVRWVRRAQRTYRHFVAEIRHGERLVAQWFTEPPPGAQLTAANPVAERPHGRRVLLQP